MYSYQCDIQLYTNYSIHSQLSCQTKYDYRYEYRYGTYEDGRVR